MDTEEMYQRGQADAAHENLNPFYYQHYYQYRRGYDSARRGNWVRLMPLVIGAVIVLALGAIGARALIKPPAAGVTAAAVATVPTATPAPLFPTPTVPPAPTAPPAAAGLQVGGAALVQTAGRALRGRAAPKLSARVQATFGEGERVSVLEGPVEADGFRWWRIAGAKGNGWSAERSQDGEIWILPQP